MKTKAIVALFCVAIFLFGCAPALNAATETSIVVPTETATATIAATSVPTETSIPITPTAEAGPKAGDTKAETINGVTDTFTYYDEVINGGEIKGWFRPLIVDLPFFNIRGVMVGDGNGGGYRFKDNIGSITLLLEDNVSSEELIQSYIHQTSPPSQAPSHYISLISSSLFKQYFHTDSDPNLGTPQGAQFWRVLDSGNFPHTFTVGSNSYTWNLGPGPNSGGVKVFARGYTDAGSMKQNGFTDWFDGANKDSTHFATKFDGVDAQGNLWGEIAVNKPLNELTDKELSILPLYHITTVIDNPNADVSKVGFDSLLQGLIANATTDNPPEISIQK